MIVFIKVDGVSNLICLNINCINESIKNLLKNSFDVRSLNINDYDFYYHNQKINLDNTLEEYSFITNTCIYAKCKNYNVDKFKLSIINHEIKDNCLFIYYDKSKYYFDKNNLFQVYNSNNNLIDIKNVIITYVGLSGIGYVRLDNINDENFNVYYQNQLII